jgi:hypothetical protein
MSSASDDPILEAAGLVAPDVTGLTVIVLARDAGATLHVCLDSVTAWRHVLVVVDARTSDDSALVAQEAGATVVP